MKYPPADWREELAALIDRARKEGKWLWCRGQDLLFSPDFLAAENAAGRYCWGAGNWTLVDPPQPMKED